MSDKMSFIAKILALIGALSAAAVVITLICKKVSNRKKQALNECEKAYLDLDDDCKECFFDDNEDYKTNEEE